MDNPKPPDQIRPAKTLHLDHRYFRYALRMVYNFLHFTFSEIIFKVKNNYLLNMAKQQFATYTTVYPKLTLLASEQVLKT